MASWTELGGVLIPLLSTDEAHLVQLHGAAQYKRGRELQETFQHRALKVINGQKHLQYKERLRELWLFSPGKKSLSGTP